jgi:hypothetical protein
MKKKILLTLLTASLSVILFSVSGQTSSIELKESPEQNKNEIGGILRVTGKGFPPNHSGLNSDQAKILAQRAAIVDSYRNMVKLIQDENAYLVDGNGLLQFQGFVQGAQVVETRYLNDQSVEVDLVLPVRFLPEIKKVIGQDKNISEGKEGLTVLDVDKKVIEIQQSEWQGLVNEVNQAEPETKNKE